MKPSMVDTLKNVMIRTEKLTAEDIDALETLVARNIRWTQKIIKYACIVLAFPLFVPIEILSLFRSSGTKLDHESSFLYFELGPMNVLLYLLLPTAIIILLIYLLFLKVPAMKRDLRNQNKIVVDIKVMGIDELQGREKKDLWMFTHKILFEPNDYGYTEQLFQSFQNPNYLNAGAFRLHLTENARAELKREVIDNTNQS
jgi:hypothetical protein